jgi:hypothetical protein
VPEVLPGPEMTDFRDELFNLKSEPGPIIMWHARCPHGLPDQSWVSRGFYTSGRSVSVPLCRCH